MSVSIRYAHTLMAVFGDRKMDRGGENEDYYSGCI